MVSFVDLFLRLVLSEIIYKKDLDQDLINLYYLQQRKDLIVKIKDQ